MFIEGANTETGYRLVYNPKDTVKITHSDTFHITPGDVGKVTKGPFKSGSTTMYELSLDSISSSWGYVDLPQNYFKPYGVTRAKLPELIREWKQKQVKKLIGA